MANTTKNRISRPVIEREISLKTPCAQRVFNRSYNEVSRNLYSLGVVSRVLASEEVADEVDAIVQQRLKEMEEALQAERERLEALREENGVDQLPTYTEPKAIPAGVSSPTTFQYLSLIQSLDELVVRLDSLWLTDVFTSKQKLRAEYLWQKRMIKLANQLRDLYNRSKAAARRQGKEVLEDASGKATEAEDKEEPVEKAANGEDHSEQPTSAPEEHPEPAQAAAAR